MAEASPGRLDAGRERDAEGFLRWNPPSDRFDRVFGVIRAREEGERVRCRVAIGRGETNAAGTIHGGFLLAFADEVLFIAAGLRGRLTLGRAVTLSASSQFVGAGAPGEPLDAVVEVVRETGQLLFMRGLMEQDGRAVMSFEGIVRKLGTPS